MFYNIFLHLIYWSFTNEYLCKKYTIELFVILGKKVKLSTFLAVVCCAICGCYIIAVTYHPPPGNTHTRIILLLANFFYFIYFPQFFIFFILLSFYFFVMIFHLLRVHYLCSFYAVSVFDRFLFADFF